MFDIETILTKIDNEMESTQPTLTESESNYWRQKLHSLRQSCGCKTGMVALLITLAAALYYFLLGEGEIYSSGKKFLYIFLLSMAGAVLGKLTGISWSRIRYYRLRKKLLRKGVAGLGF